jgi:hypothetical protein
MKYSVNPAISELERAYQFFNGELFGGGLDSNVVITIQSRGRKSALGWHWAAKWKNGDTTSLAEINLSAEELKTGDPYEVLIHEMAHHLNHQKGIKDVSRGQYHNKRFKEAAESAGLEVKRVGNVGWGITALGDLAKAKLLKFTPQKEVFALLRVHETGTKEPKHRKWSCSCGVNVRVGRRDFDATCNLCGTRFELTEGL